MKSAEPIIPTSAPVLVCAFDDNYAMSAAVMLKSAELNLATYTQIRVFVLERALRKANRERIAGSLDPARVQLVWVPVDEAKINGLKVDRHVSKATYYRLLIEELLPALDRAIYLDSDVLVCGDLGQLWDTPREGAHLLAAPQVSPDASTAGSVRGLRTYKALGLASDAKLFNAGVLLIDLALWRRDSVSDRVIAYLRQYADEVLWWDQDGLNAILAGHWRPLDGRWNVMTSLFRYYCSWMESPFNERDYYGMTQNPLIVHYNSTSKPWQPDYIRPFRDLFYEYLDETAWRGWRPGTGGPSSAVPSIAHENSKESRP